MLDKWKASYLFLSLFLSNEMAALPLQFQEQDGK